MERYKEEFIDFMVECQVLRFGDFVTKSGRKTPFFVNTGFYRTGSQLAKLGEYYAQALANTTRRRLRRSSERILTFSSDRPTREFRSAPQL